MLLTPCRPHSTSLLVLKFNTLGFTDNSLQVNQINANNEGGSIPIRDNARGIQSTDFIEIKLDRVYNRIMFEYMFEDDQVDLDIRFKVVLKNQFDISMVNSRNFTFHADSLQYHENGLRTGKVEMVDRLTKGFDQTTLESHFQLDNTNEEPMNMVLTEEELQHFDIGKG